jgi:hypothetical protein
MVKMKTPSYLFSAVYVNLVHVTMQFVKKCCISGSYDIIFDTIAMIYYILYCDAISDPGNSMKHRCSTFGQKVGRYKMVSEHSVACRIETLGLN